MQEERASINLPRYLPALLQAQEGDGPRQGKKGQAAPLAEFEGKS